MRHKKNFTAVFRKRLANGDQREQKSTRSSGGHSWNSTSEKPAMSFLKERTGSLLLAGRRERTTAQIECLYSELERSELGEAAGPRSDLRALQLREAFDAEAFDGKAA